MTGYNICSKDKLYYLCVIIFATVCAMLYAQATSIFTPNTYSFDAAIFMHIGQAIKDGYVPYRDIYDIKDPAVADRIYRAVNTQRPCGDIHFGDNKFECHSGNDI